MATYKFKILWVISLGSLFLGCAQSAFTPQHDTLAEDTEQSSRGQHREENQNNQDQPGSDRSGALFFSDSVIPAFERSCASCHAEPRLVTGISAPLSVFDYEKMHDYLIDGGSATESRLIRKMLNSVAHGGGRQCLGDLSREPCKTVLEWYEIETGKNQHITSGAIDSVSSVGVVRGWAKDPENESQKLDITFYVGGPYGSGQPAGEIRAAEFGPGGPGAGHYFNYELPSRFRDGVEKTLYAYIGDPADGNLLPGTPYGYTAYTPKAQSFFESTVRPRLNRCASCHSVDYLTQYTNLISPTPFGGATALDNDLINKASGSVPHGGGNICGNKNSSPCLEIQQWWQMEFGS